MTNSFVIVSARALHQRIWCRMKSEDPVQEGLRKLPIRPIYLVSCEHDGKKNIISVGMFAYFSGKPTLVGIGIAPSRYSYELIQKSKAYAVNVVDEKLIEAVRICGENSARHGQIQVGKADGNSSEQDYGASY